MNEYGVIGSLLIDSSLFPEAAGLPDQAFSSPALQEVFRTMRRQYEGRGGFDALTVSVEARRNCPEVTDELLAQMMDITPTTANLDAYIAAVKEEFLARSLREIGAGLMEAEQAPLEALGRVQDALQRLTEENTRGDTDTLTDALVRLGNRVAEQVNGKAPCVPSGLMSFDKLLGGGFINGGLHVIGARPAVGKSAVALQLALNAARNGVKVLYCSLEMSAEDCSARLVGNLGGVSSSRLMFGGKLTDREYEQYAQGTNDLSVLPIVFNRRSGMNVRQVEALAYREKPGLLILDHLGLLEPPETRLSLYEATTRNSRALKLLAMRLNIPVLCLCQLNRAAASDRSGSFRATMANLRESGAIEQDADTVTLLHNPPCETDDRMESPSLLELWLDKNRRGATGHVDATFYKVTGRVTA
jgi:replicative DNA helicase